MKKIYTILFLLVFATTKLIAQVPYKMSYQTVVRNSTNQLVNNQQVGIKISLLQGSATGNAVFTQNFAPTTNANGLATIVIGDTSAAYNSISWASGGPFFIKTEIDPAGGTNYSIEATSELMSVPYAMVAGSVAGLGNSALNIFDYDDELSQNDVDEIIKKDGGKNTQSISITIGSKVKVIDLNKTKISNKMTNFSISSFKHNDDIDTILCDNVEVINQNDFNSGSAPGNYILAKYTSLKSLKKLYSSFLTISGLSLNSLPNLTTFIQSDFGGGYNITGDYVNMPKLVNAAFLAISAKNGNITLPKLKNVNGSLKAFCNNCIANPDFSSLERVYFGFKYYDINMTKISFPLLKSIDNGDIEISNNNKLKEIDIDSLKFVYNILFSNNSLTTSCINKILRTIVTNNTVVNGSIDLSGQNPPAPPTGQGILDKQALIAKGIVPITD